MKKYLYITVFALLLAAFLQGCSGCPEKEKSYSPFVKSFLGNYGFKMSDSSGKTIAEGLISPKDFTDPNISGTYTVTNFVESSFKSEISQSNNFTGVLEEKTKKVFINLNPKIADNNIYLRLDFSGSELKGTWEKSTMTGLHGKGIFTAVKK